MRKPNPSGRSILLTAGGKSAPVASPGEAGAHSAPDPVPQDPPGATGAGTGFLASIAYLGASRPFVREYFSGEAAARRFVAAWIDEARRLGYDAAGTVERTAAPPGERATKGACLPVKPSGKTTPPVQTAERQTRILAELARRGLTLFDAPLPVREIAEAVALSRSSVFDALQVLRVKARKGQG